MTAWAYLVVSTEQQTETLAFQEKWAADVAAEHGWTIARTFSGASTGKAGVRKLLDQLLAELRATPKRDRPERILMIRLDRTGRGMALDAIAALAEIMTLGAIVHTRQDGDVKIERAVDSIAPIMRIVTGALENEAKRDKMLAWYDRRRRAGLPLAMNAPFGLVRPRSDSPFEPDPETAWIVAAADELLVAGDSLGDVFAWVKTLHPRAWQSYTGLRQMMKQTAYVAAGVRSPETQARLDQRLARARDRFGSMRRWEHEFGGVFACGLCVELGYDPMASRMHATTIRSRLGEPVRMLSCHRHLSSKGGHTAATAKRHRRMMIATSRVGGVWTALLRNLRSTPEAMALWAECRAPADEERRRGAQRALEEANVALAALKARRDSAVELYGRLGASALTQVDQLLDEVATEIRAIDARRVAAQLELARVPAQLRDPGVLRALLASIEEQYEALPIGKRGEFNRRLVDVIGSVPVLSRSGRTRHAEIVFSWPQLGVEHVIARVEVGPREKLYTWDLTALREGATA